MNETGNGQYTVHIPIREKADIPIARKWTREIGRRVGLRDTAIEELAIATSEIAHNILVHALVGEVRLRVMAKGDMEAVEVVASDYGPGIADLDRALQDGYSTANGLGLGLSSARRLVDDFDLASAAGRGTTVTLRKWRHGKD